MPRAPDEQLPAQAQIDAGWEALRAGDWARARASFDGALAIAEGPEGFEGLSWAAWWEDDAETVIRCRERAYQLYREAGEPASGGRMATWLAADQVDFHGATAVAHGWLRRAHRLLDRLEPIADHGWLAFVEGHLARIAGETARSAELGRRAAELGRRLAAPDLEMLGLALEGSNLVVEGRVAEGMRCLDEATAVALEGEAEIPISAAWACCHLVSACETVRDYERASAWCDQIAEFADRFESRYMLAFCRAGYGAIALWRGRWQEAEIQLRSAADEYGRSRPALAGTSLTTLAELRRRQGRREEAEQLLDQVGTSAGAQLCRGRMALDRGADGEAAELAERILRQIPGQHRLDRIPALELLARAQTSRGQFDHAAAAIASLSEVEQLGGTAPLRAALDLAEGRLAAARGEHELARPLLEDAVDRFERCGGPFEAAQARIELAASLRDLGREQPAGELAAAALDALLTLEAPVEAERARRVLAKPELGEAPPLARLTPREREVLLVVAEGLTNRQIAERLVVSEHTVHRHVTNLLGKLELPSRAAAAALAAQEGLLGDLDRSAE